ncbi:nucleotidyl transferase AbiEii/AbiGii toxin family protein [Candidatus Roizmanbacteria bacterium]|nr:nucleotidyl transferase AbiEii/AbiGii toxin family protein [Candidatus Roizmanbacteria bacterium]
MILPKREDVFHKIQLYRLLTSLLDSDLVLRSTYFKGGTCASMLGFLDRFSIDLDFDLKKGVLKTGLDKELRRIFEKLDLEVDKKSSKTLYYILKYQSEPGLRNSLKLSLIDRQFKNNDYRPFYLKEIDRYANCQTIETMFANKLVALTDRYKKTKSIAGRDLYDIHHFFLRGYRYNGKIIKERTGKDMKSYLKELIDFIEQKASDRIINEDLNYLLPRDKFKKIKKILKKETIMLLKDELKRNG